MELDFHLHAERTPNPNSLKWVLGQPVMEGGASAHFDEAPAPEVSPLGARLFGVRGIVGVFCASNFITVTKDESVEWPDVAQELVDVIKAFFASGEPALGPDYVAPSAGPQGEIVERIQRILEQEIRPAVAMDGGDIVFAGFRDGVVELYLQGACSGCPSSTATLKLGIEQRLREDIPEVLEVVAL